MIDQLSNEMMKAIMETLPVDISVTDEKDEVVYWNRHETRIFKRPWTSMGLNVRQCHPEKSLAMVERILDEMRSGKRDMARFWIDYPVGPGKIKRKVVIDYYALRDASGKFLGCMEADQVIDDLKTIEGQKRLLD